MARPDPAVFAEDFRAEPFWWERSPRPEAEAGALPGEVDVAIVGSGYTGLNAALVLARGGRSVLALDAEAAGWGCSSRNGGQVSTSIKPGYGDLAKRHGDEAARAILSEGIESLAWLGEFLREEGIDCDHRVCGRFHAAHTPARFETLARAAESQPKGLEQPVRVVPRAEQGAEIGSDSYHGGVVHERHANLDPGRYHLGLLARAREAGVRVASHTPVTGLKREGGGYELQTPRGALRAREVVVATNGYTGPLTPWHRRRVIPIGSYMIATEPLAEGMAERLMPRDRAYSDTRKVVYYYRLSPDRRRILFGGRVSAAETDPLVSAPRLRRDLAALFPELEGVRVSRSWMGFVAYSFDTLPHIGGEDGLHYAMGYCGSGVGLASYLGMRLGHRVLGRPEGRTGLDGLRFQTRPLYTGRPWFLAASVAWYRWRDRRSR